MCRWEAGLDGQSWAWQKRLQSLLFLSGFVGGQQDCLFKGNLDSHSTGYLLLLTVNPQRTPMKSCACENVVGGSPWLKTPSREGQCKLPKPSELPGPGLMQARHRRNPHSTAWAHPWRSRVSSAGLAFQGLAASLPLLLDIPTLASCFSVSLQKQNKKILLSTVPWKALQLLLYSRNLSYFSHFKDLLFTSTLKGNNIRSLFFGWK